MADFNTVRLEKGMYGTAKGFSKTLEELDPSENYKGTSLEGLDAFQRQLKRFDIRVSGAGSDSVEKFFATSESAALFPEYVSRAVRQGMESANILPKIVATTTKIDALDYRTVSSVPGESEKELKEVAEGAFIPTTTIKTNEKLVKLHKRGRMLVASYEAIKYQKLDLFTVMLRQIGAYISRSQMRDAIDVLTKSAVSSAPETAGELTYKDIIKLWNRFDPYTMNTLITSPDMAEKLLALPEFRDAAAGLSFHATGKLITPLGAEMIKSADVPEGSVLALDKTCALEMIQAGDIGVEYDKLIDRQLERAAITVTAGFSPIFPDAAAVLKV